MKYRLIELFATFLYCGKSPKAPGTVGSIGATIVLAALAYSVPDPTFTYILIAGVWIFWLGGVWAANHVIDHTGKKDPQEVVIDEAAGLWLSFALVPHSWLIANPWTWLVGLVLFRIFDISKILGIKKLEEGHRGWGVMNDDMLGGVYSALLLALIHYLHAI
jgi:phosphatidylglycerophosphatase A